MLFLRRFPRHIERFFTWGNVFLVVAIGRGLISEFMALILQMSLQDGRYRPGYEEFLCQHSFL